MAEAKAPDETRVVLARHGHVAGITPPRFRGRTDLALTERGVRQAEMTRDYLSGVVHPASIYTSPLSRCVRTGEILAQPYALTTCPLAAFTDIDYGAWQGKTYDEVQVAEPVAFMRWRSAPHLAAIPGGERLYDVASRVAGVTRMILDRHRGETVLMVGHDSVNRVLLLLALDLPLSRFWHLQQDPCALSVLDFEDAFSWTTRSINETAHLWSPTADASARAA